MSLSEEDIDKMLMKDLASYLKLNNVPFKQSARKGEMTKLAKDFMRSNKQSGRSSNEANSRTDKSKRNSPARGHSSNTKRNVQPGENSSKKYVVAMGPNGYKDTGHPYLRDFLLSLLIWCVAVFTLLVFVPTSLLPKFVQVFLSPIRSFIHDLSDRILVFVNTQKEQRFSTEVC